jgi:hypothetical protein
MQRINAMQPDRGGGEPEREAGAAGGNAAEQGANPKVSQVVVRISGQHRSTQIEDEDEADREHGRQADRQRH